jgi:hypothetical protein
MNRDLHSSHSAVGPGVPPQAHLRWSNRALALCTEERDGVVTAASVRSVETDTRCIRYFSRLLARFSIYTFSSSRMVHKSSARLSSEM